MGNRQKMEELINHICCMCKKEFEGFGNNAEPLMKGICCDDCNISVIRERLKLASEHPTQKKLF